MITGEPSLAELAQSRARVQLCHLPTPLEPLRNADSVIPGRRADVFVKRDDLTGFSTAGNKGRLLEFLVADAIAQGAQTVVGCGPSTSNFVSALAQVSAVHGLRCEIVIPEQIIDTPSLALARSAGASVTAAPVTRHEIDQWVADRAAHLTLSGEPAYAIPRGGASAVAAVGYALAAEEVTRQLPADCSATIVIPAGSCASAAGLVAGLTLLNSSHNVVAVSTNRPVDEARDVLTTLSTDVVGLLGGNREQAKVDVGTRFTLLDEATEPRSEDYANVARALRLAGIVAADHYGPATLTALCHVATSQENPVVWWHTGGVLGIPRLLSGLAI